MTISIVEGVSSYTIAESVPREDSDMLNPNLSSQTTNPSSRGGKVDNNT